MLDAVAAAWAQTSQLEIVSVIFGLAYVILAARENPWCWPAALIGTGTGILVFWDASLVMESSLNVFYLLMAVYGWWAWQHGGGDNEQLPITRWGWRQQSVALGLIAVLTFLSGSLLGNHSDAALPYVDSFTTWSAVITTWMVTRKILQNWLYWVVIDTVSVWLFIQRDLYLYALLFVLYTVIAIYGYWNWRQRALHAA